MDMKYQFAAVENIIYQPPLLRLLLNLIWILNYGDTMNLGPYRPPIYQHITLCKHMLMNPNTPNITRKCPDPNDHHHLRSHHHDTFFNVFFHVIFLIMSQTFLPKSLNQNMDLGLDWEQKTDQTKTACYVLFYMQKKP